MINDQRGVDTAENRLEKCDLIALAEVFLILEKWQYELDLKRQKENPHSGQHHSPTECRQQDSQKLS